MGERYFLSSGITINESANIYYEREEELKNINGT